MVQLIRVCLFIIVTLLINSSFSSTSNVYELKYKPTCDFYKNLFSRLNCSQDNYLISFAFPYCNKFLKDEDKYTISGKIFLKNTRKCLIQKMEQAIEDSYLNDSSGLTCEDAETIGFQSHVSCYVSNNFCHLPLVDKLRILRRIFPEINNPKVSEVKNKLNKYCMSNFFKRME